jgi:hypothetical protein
MLFYILGIFAVLYAAYRRYTRLSISHIPGPKPESFLLGAFLFCIFSRDAYLDKLLGNLPEIFQSQVGVPDFKYQREYGDVVRVKGPLGVRKTFKSHNLIIYTFFTGG